MARIPVTSVSLIRTIAADPQSARWEELYRLYEAPMRAFLLAKYPSLEPEDVIQEAMLSLMKKLPNYRYTPDENGHFRNYLLGILKHKAMDALSRRVREQSLRDQYASASPVQGAGDDSWKETVLEVAIAQLMADDSVNPLHRTVFRHVALEHERPESVAARFGLSRANVDQIKKRLISKLSSMVADLI